MQDFTMRLYRAFALKVCLLISVCLLVGCSALRLGYSNGESVVYWWLNSYVDFEADQEPWVKRHLRNLFQWHRTTQLNEYAQLLSHTQKQLGHDATQSDVLIKYDAIKKNTLVVIDKALPALAELALSLQPNQIAHLEEKFSSNNVKYRKEYLRGDLEQRQLFRFKKVMQQAEYWFGDFSEEQQAQIRAASNTRPLNNELWMEVRQRRQQELITLLKKIQHEKPGREATAALLKGYVAGVLTQFGDAKHQALAAESTRETARMVTRIITIATPEQKARAGKRLQKLIDDFHAMAKAGEAA